MSTLVGVAAFAAVTLVGLGPAAWLARSTRTESANVFLALAPACGIAVTAAVVFPLVRFVGPVRVWAFPVLLALIVLSLIACAVLRKALQRPSSAEALSLLVALGVVTAVLLGWTLAAGPGRFLYGYNPADALTYLTIADAVLNAGWDVILAGQAVDSTPASATLIEQSPTALYSARAVAMTPIRVATMIDLAWLRAVGNLAPHAVLNAFTTAAVLSTVAAYFSLGRHLGLGSRLSAVIATATGLCFWSLMIIEHEGYSQLQLQPLLALFIVLLALSIGEYADKVATVVAAAVCALAIFVIYTEFTPIFLLSLATAAALVFVLSPTARYRVIASSSAIIGLTAGLALVTGQFQHHVASLSRQLRAAQEHAGQLGSISFDIPLARSVLHALLGTWWINPSILASFVFAGSLVGIAISLLRRPLPIAGQIAAAFVAVPFTLSAVVLGRYGDSYGAFKLYSTVFPIALALVGFVLSCERAWTALSLALRACAIFILFSQFGFAVRYLYRESLGRPGEHLRQLRVGAVDLDAIVRELERVRPRALVVNVPPTTQWWNAAFLALAVSPFRPFYQSGYIVNNDGGRLYHALLGPPERPDFALLATSDDYLRDSRAAELVVDFGGTRLYRILAPSEGQFGYRVPR